MNDRIKNIINDKFKEIIITEKVQLGLNATKIIRDLKEDTYSKRKALETIQDSFEVLKGINIFEEG